jgi:hypothetical protein
MGKRNNFPQDLLAYSSEEFHIQEKENSEMAARRCPNGWN